MEEGRDEILKEIRQMLSSMEESIAAIKAKLAELEANKTEVETITPPEQLFEEPEEEVVIDLDILEDTLEEPKEEKQEKPLEEFFKEEEEVKPVKEKIAVVDAMLDKEAWRTDIPSSPVKDIRSAISLNDRILFINKLFGGDPETFQADLSALNDMSCFEDGVNYIREKHSEWKMSSEIVYRFMMAVRRKLEK